MNKHYALVTGGSRGIGRAICRQLARDGYHVLINYISNHTAAHDTLTLIEQENGCAELLPFDVSNPKAILPALTNWQNAHPNEYIEVLVNNAGIVRDNILLDMQPDDWHSVIDTNLNGFYYITRQLLEPMLVNHYGRIINMSSIAARCGYRGQTNYAAAKAALIGVTQSLAMEVAPKKITVNAIAPGLINTEMVNNIPTDIIKKHIPMRRLGQPEEVANLVSFLVSERAAYITGQVIGIDGGGFCL